MHALPDLATHGMDRLALAIDTPRRGSSNYCRDVHALLKAGSSREVTSRLCGAPRSDLQTCSLAPSRLHLAPLTTGACLQLDTLRRQLLYHVRIVVTSGTHDVGIVPILAESTQEGIGANPIPTVPRTPRPHPSTIATILAVLGRPDSAAAAPTCTCQGREALFETRLASRTLVRCTLRILLLLLPVLLGKMRLVLAARPAGVHQLAAAADRDQDAEDCCNDANPLPAGHTKVLICQPVASARAAAHRLV